MAACQKLKLIRFGGEDGQHLAFIALHEQIATTEADVPCGMDLSARQFIAQLNFAFTKLLV